MLLELHERERKILKRILESTVRDIRTERLKTDNYEWRKEMRADEEIVRDIIENLQQSEYVMDVKGYCSGVSAELQEWMEKIEQVSLQFEEIPSHEKENAGPEIAKLQEITDQLGKRIRELKDDCTRHWKHESLTVN